jgi:putative transposase
MLATRAGMGQREFMPSCVPRARVSQRFLSAHDQIDNLFHLRRDDVTVSEYRAARGRAFAMWAEASGVAVAA